ncbi:MAG TPA: DMT family transporter [Frankiaceae bacterium]|nr:DMT family transporter [Frankiaceae bacterium]
MFLAAIVALISAFCFAIASVAQHHVAQETQTAQTLNPRLFLQLAKRPLWWAGSFGDLFGFIIQAVALSLGAVALVQPLLVTGLLLAIPLSAAVDKRKVVRAEVYGALLCCAGLAAFLLAAQPSEGNQHVTGNDGLLLLASVGPIVIALVLASRKFHGVARSVALALSAGTLFAVCSPLLSVVVRDLHHAFEWPLATIFICGAIGFLLTQNAYQAGSLPAPLACITICEPMVAVTLSVTLLHEHLDAGPVGLCVIVLAVAAVVIGVIMVARNAPDARRASPAAEKLAA